MIGVLSFDYTISRSDTTILPNIEYLLPSEGRMR
jgi:hypothetical protein